jgi:hypothetical protein
LTLNTFGVDERPVEKQRYEMICFDFFNVFAVDERLVEKKDIVYCIFITPCYKLSYSISMYYCRVIGYEPVSGLSVCTSSHIQASLYLLSVHKLRVIFYPLSMYYCTVIGYEPASGLNNVCTSSHIEASLYVLLLGNRL